MSISPFIRTAVSICLIAALVIQPMAMVAAQGGCDRGAAGVCCASDAACTGCKCCDVGGEGSLRGCCGDKEAAADGCGTPLKTRWAVDDSCGEFTAALSEPPARDDDALMPESDAVSACMCGIRSEPAAPLPHRAPELLVRSLVVIAYLDHVDTSGDPSIRPDLVTSRLPIGDISPHFSQRVLCIWRI